MEHIKNNKNNNLNPESNGESIEVLYQKMGDRWFAFSLINDEVYTGSLTQDEINEAEAKMRASRKKTPRPS